MYIVLLSLSSMLSFPWYSEWLDKDNQVTPLTDEQLNPVWKILNYETGKYESVQKHFRVFEV